MEKGKLVASGPSDHTDVKEVSYEKAILVNRHAFGVTISRADFLEQYLR